MQQTHRRDPDRLLPTAEATRGIARELYELVEDAPIISPHGHVPAAMLAEDEAFSDPAELFITRDHYVTRLLHADGVSLDELGVGGVDFDSRLAWRTLAGRWHLFAGTASGYWIEDELANVFEIDAPLNPATADDIYEIIGEKIQLDAFRPRALLDRFKIEVIATTDDPLDDLRHHEVLAEAGIGTRVLPTFRPDKYVDATAAAFVQNARLLLSSEAQPSTFAGYLSALESRRRYFIERGAVSADHGVVEPLSLRLSAARAEDLFQAVLCGKATQQDKRELAAHLLWQMARMSVDDGLVMTLHAGVLRNHSTETFARSGPDTGHDIPVPTSFVEGLRPILESFGLRPDFHFVLFAVDETTFSREIAPLAGFYPSVYIGAPWWFLDAPHAVARFREAVTETAGFFRSSGFIDDTRAFLSIPARHDMARRADAAYLARLVSEGRVRLDTAGEIISSLVRSQPRKVFKL
jgi:glucuronate isomerase